MKFDAVKKRISELESISNFSTIPDMIQIFYDPQRKKYIAKELTFKKDQRGRIEKGFHEKNSMYDKYQDFIVNPFFMGQIILNLMDEEKGLYSFSGYDIRKACDCYNMPFSIAYKEPESPTKAAFTVTIYEE